MKTEAETLDELRGLLNTAQTRIDDAQAIITLQANGKDWAELSNDDQPPAAKKWQPPKLRPFDKGDWMSYPGCDSDEPLIAEVVVEGLSCDLVVEPNCVGIYGVRIFNTHGFDGKPEDEIISYKPEDEIISYHRHWRDDEFTQEYNLGGKFAAWVIDALREETTFAELVDTWGFENDM